MYFDYATKEQLLQIALFEDCEIDLKAAAARELQERYIPEDIRADMIYQIGTGTDIKQVAKENGLTSLQVVDFLRNMHRKGKHIGAWLKGYKRTLRACGRKIYGNEKYFMDMRGE